MLNRPLSGPEQGSSLVEVLVSVVILSIGMMSMIWAMTKSLGFQQSAEFRNLASQYALDYADRARANVGAYQHYAHAQPYRPRDPVRAASADCSAEKIVCSAEQMAEYDRSDVRRRLRATLPGGDLFVEAQDGRRLSIWVIWQQPHQLGSEDQSAGSGTSALSTSSQCPAGAGQLEATTQCQFLGVRL